MEFSACRRGGAETGREGTMMKALRRFAVILAVVLPAAVAQTAAAQLPFESSAQRITISDAEKIWLPVPPGYLVVSGGERYITVTEDPRLPGHVYVQGESPGLEVVYVGNPESGDWQRYEISVVRGAESMEIKGGLERLLADLPNLQIQTVGETVIVDGVVDDPADFARIQSLVASSDGRIESLATLAARSQILVQIDFVEVEKSLVESIGLNWENPFTTIMTFYQLFAGPQFGIVGGTPGYLNRLSGRDGQGLGFESGANPDGAILQLEGADVVFRVWETHTLMAMSGEPASYGFGSTVHTVLPGGFGGEGGMQETRLGVDIELIPTRKRDGRIELEMSYRVTDLIDGDISQAFRTTRAEQSTTVVLDDSELLVIGGVLKRRKRKTQRGLPGLRGVPVAGWLFGSKQFEKGETYSAIFITPRVVRDGNEPLPHHDIYNRTMERYNKPHNAL
jgi:Flp pilus assembly secretin CpaC